MSTAIKSPNPEPAHHYIVRRTVEACHMAKEAAGAAAEGIATGSTALLNSLRQRERELDTLDLEIDNGVTTAITEVAPAEARELLACMKFMIGLERIGDLLLSFANSALSVSGRIDSEDTRDLTQMATLLEKMLTDCGDAFSQRDVSKAVEVLRADAEMDRLRNLIFLRHIENPENVHRSPTTSPLSKCSSTTSAAATTKANRFCVTRAPRPRTQIGPRNYVEDISWRQRTTIKLTGSRLPDLLDLARHSERGRSRR
jgi:phosphate uptake regulator